MTWTCRLYPVQIAKCLCFVSVNGKTKVSNTLRHYIVCVQYVVKCISLYPLASYSVYSLSFQTTLASVLSNLWLSLQLTILRLTDDRLWTLVISLAWQGPNKNQMVLVFVQQFVSVFQVFVANRKNMYLPPPCIYAQLSLNLPIPFPVFAHTHFPAAILTLRQCKVT